MAYGSTNLLALNLDSCTLEEFQKASLEKQEQFIRYCYSIQKDEETEIYLSKNETIKLKDFHPMTNANHAILLFYRLMSRQIPIFIFGDCWYDGEGLFSKTGDMFSGEKKKKTVFKNCWNYHNEKGESIEHNFLEKFCETICITYLIIEDFMIPISEEEQKENEKSKEFVNEMIDKWKDEKEQ